MKYLLLVVFLCPLMSFSQDSEFYYKQGLDFAQTGNYDKALTSFDKSIELKPDEYVAWYNRAIVKSLLGHYEDALVDLEQTIKLNPGYKKAYLNRGTAKKHLTDYAGAMSDFTLSMQLDSAYSEAYYNRGLIYQMFGKKDLACEDFNGALKYGFTRAQKKVDKCQDTTKEIIEMHPILALSKASESRRYGFSQDNPVKIGTGYDGGPANERAYFDLLRDAQGKPIQYTRVSSCCAYASKNGPLGLAMLDKYEITYLDEKGEEKKSMVYISFYDYEGPEILLGFRTVKK